MNFVFLIRINQLGLFDRLLKYFDVVLLRSPPSHKAMEGEKATEGHPSQGSYPRMMTCMAVPSVAGERSETAKDGSSNETY